MEFSRRLPVDLRPSELSTVLATVALRDDVIDLREQNPTRCGFDYPHEDLRAAFADPRAFAYDPAPLGLVSARAAIGELVGVGLEEVVITASTSEAYGLLFKALCDPGDRVAIATPSYPLLEHLARLDGVEVAAFPLAYDTRWSIDLDSLGATLAGGVRALLLVSPNNPTGSCPSPAEVVAVREICARYDVALIVDEVFRTYGFFGELPTLAPSDPDSGEGPPVTILLDGLSKRAGLPGVKLGWMQLYGEQRAELRQRLEWLSDTYLSVGAPVQVALPAILELAPVVQTQIAARVRYNRERLVAAVAALPEVDLLAAHGGWYAIIKVPRVCSEGEWVRRLAVEHGLILQPGFLYDFARDGYLILSLLPPAATFDDGVTRLHTGVRALIDG